MKGIVFVSYLENKYSRSGVLLSALKKQGSFSVSHFQMKSFQIDNIAKYISFLRELNPLNDLVVVMSPSHMITPLTKCFFKGVVILDAGWPLSDSSRIRKGRFSLTYLKDKLIDYIAMF